MASPKSGFWLLAVAELFTPPPGAIAVDNRREVTIMVALAAVFTRGV